MKNYTVHLYPIVICSFDVVAETPEAANVEAERLFHAERQPNIARSAYAEDMDGALVDEIGAHEIVASFTLDKEGKIIYAE